MEERNVKISLERARDWYNKGGELKEIALSAFTENEITTSVLPNTWEEFCKLYPIKEEEYYIELNSIPTEVPIGERFDHDDKNILPSKKAAEAHLALMQLHQLRDCYRQGWVPDWSSIKQWKWYICLDTDILTVKNNFNFPRFLSFQSEDIARKFLNNFKDLIETAGDLI